MSAVLPSKASENRSLFVISITVTFAMVILYIVLDILQPAEPLLSLLAFVPGVISIVALRAAGLSNDQLYLRPARISLAGLGGLAVTTVLLLPFLAQAHPGSAGSGCLLWSTRPHRDRAGTLLSVFAAPGVGTSVQGQKGIGTACSLSDIYRFPLPDLSSHWITPPILIVAFVLFLPDAVGDGRSRRSHSGMAMLQHSLFLVLMSMFGWG